MVIILLSLFLFKTKAIGGSFKQAAPMIVSGELIMKLMKILEILCNNKEGHIILRGGLNMIDQWIHEIKAKADPEALGMMLAHNGVVRGTAKDGKLVKGMKLSFDGIKLESCVTDMKKRDGIVEIRVWINQGELKIGDDIMYVLVAGRFRTDVLPVLQELLTYIKTEVVREEEFVSE
jgi:molybdopterin synthase catalytic subunit